MLIIADTHIGVTKPDKLLALIQLLEANKDVPVLWLGDAFDIVMIEDSYTLYSYLIKSNDIMISGNHDYGLFETRSLWVGNTYFTHGDLVDFGYIFGRLQSKSNLSPLELIVSKLRKWSLTDLYNFYSVSYELTDDEVSYINIDKLKRTKQYVKLLTVILKVLFKLLAKPIEQPLNIPTLPVPKGSDYLGYFTHDPIELLKRILLMYPEAINADIIVIGHTHYPCDIELFYNDKTYRLITLGAWIGNRGTSYGLLTDDRLEVITI